MQRRFIGIIGTAAFVALVASVVGQAYGETMIFTTVGGGGQTGLGAETNCMIVSDGSSWSGGAAGVQGSAATNVAGVHPPAANVVFKFDLGSFVASMNVAYGVGNWVVEDLTLSFQYTLYANNTRFGGGAGRFDVFWVGKDSWIQGMDSPVYASDETTLSAWSGDQSNLVRQYYSWSTESYAGTVEDLASWTTDKTGERQGVMSVSLGQDMKLVRDIMTTDGGSRVSFYLMAVDDSLGLTIFTGGASMLPTLSFEVVSIPEPATCGLLGFAGLLVIKFRRGRR